MLRRDSKLKTNANSKRRRHAGSRPSLNWKTSARQKREHEKSYWRSAVEKSEQHLRSQGFPSFLMAQKASSLKAQEVASERALTRQTTVAAQVFRWS
jgi:hypothetical protein